MHTAAATRSSGACHSLLAKVTFSKGKFVVTPANRQIIQLAGPLPGKALTIRTNPGSSNFPNQEVALYLTGKRALVNKKPPHLKGLSS